MNKNRKKLVWLVLVALMLLIPMGASAAEEPPPTPQPDGRITPPDITGVNPDPEPKEGQLSEIEAAGSVQQQAVGVPVSSEAPALLEVAPNASAKPPGMANYLAVPMRYQDASTGLSTSASTGLSTSVSCGVQALGMAMDYLNMGAGQGAAPQSKELLTALSKGGLLHEWGTGVEELAYIARQLGYAGSYSFHKWSLAQLQEQLAQGKPVVVSLGVNGQGKPGHFVTVTGISDDGQRVSYNDPAKGKVTVPTSEFMVHWSWQGYSGMVTQRGALVKKADPMLPVMGMFSALSAMTVMFSNLSKQQQGLMRVLRPMGRHKRAGRAVPLANRSRDRSQRRARNLDKTQKLRRPGSRAWSTGQGRPVPGKLSRQKRPNRVRQKPEEKRPVQGANGFVTWRSQVLPSAQEQKRASDLLHRKRAEFVQAEKQSRDQVANAEASGGRLVSQAQSALGQAQRRSKSYQQQARQRGDRMVAPARREYAQAQNRARVMLDQARRRGAAWVRTANRKLGRALSTARSWLSYAVRRGRGWIRSANNKLRGARSTARSWLSYAVRRGRGWIGYKRKAGQNGKMM